MTAKLVCELADPRRRSGREATSAPGMKGDKIDERAAFPRELGEPDGVFHGVVDAAEHDILECDTAVEALRGLDDVGEWVFHVYWRQLASQRVARRVNGDRQPKLLRSLTQRDDTWQYAHRRHGDVPRADAERIRVIQQRQRAVDRSPVHQWLAHSHEHDVRDMDRRIQKSHLSHLTGDLERVEVSLKAHGAGGAEGTLQRTSSLRRDAERESVILRNRDGLDGLAVAKHEQELLRSVGGTLPSGDRESR